jgi:hypothetical protein
MIGYILGIMAFLYLVALVLVPARRLSAKLVR